MNAAVDVLVLGTLVASAAVAARLPTSPKSPRPPAQGRKRQPRASATGFDPDASRSILVAH